MTKKTTKITTIYALKLTALLAGLLVALIGIQSKDNTAFYQSNTNNQTLKKVRIENAYLKRENLQLKRKLYGD